MDNKALFDSVMLDGTGDASLSDDLSRIAAMIDRAARAIETIGGNDADSPAPKPDASWQAAVPSSDPEQTVRESGADIVDVRHEVAESGMSVPAMTVPRVVA